MLVCCERKTLLAGWFGLAETRSEQGESVMSWFLQLRKQYIMCYSVSVQGEIFLVDNDVQGEILRILEELSMRTLHRHEPRQKEKTSIAGPAGIQSPPSIRPMS